MSGNVLFDNRVTTRHRTNDGRVMEVSAGELRGVMALSFAFRDPDDQPTDAIACHFRIADRDGRLWQTTSRFTTRLFVTHMFDLADRGWLDLFRFPRDGRRFKEESKNRELDRYQTAFRDHLLLADARYFTDDRFYRRLVVDGRLVAVKFKYLHLSLDVAGWGGGVVTDSFPVRIAGQAFWDEERDHALGPLAFDIHCTHFLRHNTGVWNPEERRWRDSLLPLPLEFMPVEGEGKPQSHVRLVE